MKTKELKMDDFILDFSQKEMAGNGMNGNGIEIISEISIKSLLEFSTREICGNGI